MIVLDSGRTKLIARDLRLGLAAREVGNHTAGDPPVPIPNTEVKPRWADCTARESVWESRSLPALIMAIERNLDGHFLFAFESFVGCGARALARRSWSLISAPQGNPVAPAFRGRGRPRHTN